MESWEGIIPVPRNDIKSFSGIIAIKPFFLGEEMKDLWSKILSKRGGNEEF